MAKIIKSAQHAALKKAAKKMASLLRTHLVNAHAKKHAITMGRKNPSAQNAIEKNH